MKIVFNTYSPTAAASAFYMAGMQSLPEIVFNDFEHYENYDVALFMTYDADLTEMRRAHAANPGLRIGLLDARGTRVAPFMDVVDFLILDSIEMEDSWAIANRPIFIYPDIPHIPMIEKHHEQKSKIIIGYHGNQAHLASMFQEYAPALDLLGGEQDIELLAVYNLQYGKCEFGLPRRIPVRHVQWHEHVYTEELAQVDIGICPALMPIRDPIGIKRKASLSKFFADNDDDYLVRYKMPSNSGRAVVFGFLGIPVVADMLPAFLQLIEHGKDGFIAHHAGGCYQAVKRLALSAELRNTVSAKMREKLKVQFDFVRINRDFLTFLDALPPQTAARRPLDFRPLLAERRSADAGSLRKINWNLRKKSILKHVLNLVGKK